MNQILQRIIERSIKGLNVETTNVDIKKEWWDLTAVAGRDEFLKDICAMANNTSNDSFIVVGLDEKGNTYNQPLPFDEAVLQEKHKDKIEPRVKIKFIEEEVSGRIISILVIPHSTNRPHIVKSYNNRRNFIPVKSGSSTQPASRSDLDKMYQERLPKNGEINIALSSNELSWDNYADFGGPSFLLKLSIDNFLSSKPDIIDKVFLEETTGDRWTGKNFMFEGQKINEFFKIEPHGVVQGINVYVSDMIGEGLRNPRKRPDVDKNSVKLIVSTRSRKIFEIPIRAGWIKP